MDACLRELVRARGHLPPEFGQRQGDVPEHPGIQGGLLRGRQAELLLRQQEDRPDGTGQPRRKDLLRGRPPRLHRAARQERERDNGADRRPHRHRADDAREGVPGAAPVQGVLGPDVGGRSAGACRQRHVHHERLHWAVHDEHAGGLRQRCRLQVRGGQPVSIAHPHVVQFGTESLDILDPRLDSEPLGHLYWKVLLAFVADTHETCRYYRDRLDRASLAPNKLRSWDDFQAIPPLAPRHVGGLLSPDNPHPASEFDLLPDCYRATMSNEGVSSRTAGDRLVRRFMTTSTTGRPKVSYYTADDWALNCACSWRQHRHVPQGSLKNVFNCFHAGHYGGKNVEDTFTRLAGCLVVNRHFSYTTPEQVMSQLCSGVGEMGEFTCLAIPPCNPTAGVVTKGVSLHDLLPLDTDNYIGRNVRVVTLGGSRADEKVYRLRERLWEAN